LQSLPTIEHRPLLRGYIHLAVAALSPAALVVMVLIADSARAIVGAAIFGAALILMHATSAVYHVLRLKQIQRLDHAMIYVLIAGTFTPFTLKVLGNAWGIPILSVVWSLAGIGVAMALVRPHLPRSIRMAPYLALGWVGLVPSYQLWQSLPRSAFALMLVAGAVYSIGGIVYAAQRPDPFPRVFGYHEVFHACTAIAALVFVAVLTQYVLSA
jgi:hemolysin III